MDLIKNRFEKRDLRTEIQLQHLVNHEKIIKKQWNSFESIIFTD